MCLLPEALFKSLMASLEMGLAKYPLWNNWDSTRSLIGWEACLHDSMDPWWEYVSMVVTSRCFAFRALIAQPRIWKGFWVESSTSVLYLPIPSSAETWKIFTKYFSRGWENSWQLSKTFSIVRGQTREVNRLIVWLVFHNTCSHKAKVWIVWSWPFYQPILINFALSAATTFSLAVLGYLEAG